MTSNEAAKARTDLSNSLLEINTQLAPIFDAADGVRVDLERRGWSPTAAEMAAAEWLTGMMRQLFK